MRIIKDTLEPLIETWDDPGDYPNALAAGPLPSYDYFAGFEGELVAELDEEEIDWFFTSGTLDYPHPEGISWIKWIVEKREGNVFTFYVEDTEGAPLQPEPDDHPTDY